MFVLSAADFNLKEAQLCASQYMIWMTKSM